jgi:hypothetical protein
MKHHVLEIFIFIVAVRAPAAGLQVNFYVTRTRHGGADLKNCAAKIRAALDADESGVNNANNSSIGCFELLAP